LLEVVVAHRPAEYIPVVVAPVVLFIAQLILLLLERFTTLL
jgi:hypothetical protein